MYRSIHSRGISVLVMHYAYGASGPSLLIHVRVVESTDSVIHNICVGLTNLAMRCVVDQESGKEGRKTYNSHSVVN